MLELELGWGLWLRLGGAGERAIPCDVKFVEGGRSRTLVCFIRQLFTITIL